MHKSHTNAGVVDTNSQNSSPILSYRITNLFLCVVVRDTTLILNNIHGTRRSLGTAYLYQQYCGLETHEI